MTNNKGKEGLLFNPSFPVAGVRLVQQPEYLQVRDELLGGKPCYVLKVRGDSMIEEGILGGDCVVIEQKRAGRWFCIRRMRVWRRWLIFRRRCRYSVLRGLLRSC